MNQDTQRKARIWLAVVFLAGVAIGGLFGYSFGHHSVLANTNNVPNLSEPERRAKRVQDMTRELGLTAEQAAKADDVIRRAHEEMKNIREKAETDVDGVREKGRDEMRTFLSPEQKPKFEEMVRRMDAERKKQQLPPSLGK